MTVAERSGNEAAKAIDSCICRYFSPARPAIRPMQINTRVSQRFQGLTDEERSSFIEIEPVIKQMPVLEMHG